MADPQDTTTSLLSRRFILAGAAVVAAPVIPVCAAPDDDPEIRLALRCWQEKTLRAAAIGRGVVDPDDEDAFAAALTEADNVARDIVSRPATTITALAIKIYLLAHTLIGGTDEHPLAIRPPRSSILYNADNDHLDDALIRALVTDAARYLPGILAPR